MTLILATATASEMRAVLTGFNGRGRVGCVMPEEGQPVVSPVNECECILLVTGVGPVNAAFQLGRTLAANKRIEGVVNLGIGGSFDMEKAPLCHGVLVDSETWPDYGLATTEGTSAEALRFPLHQDDADTVWNRIDLAPVASLHTLGLSVPAHSAIGGALTVAAASGHPARAEEMCAHGALIENMEGFALALGCRKAGLPFVEYRIVSNRVGSRAAVDWALDDAFTALGKAARALFC